jgi:dihydrofolate reductase
LPEVVYYVAGSLDGYIATPDGDVKWLSTFEGGSEDYGYAQFYASVDSVLLGRKTYEQSLTFGEWPYPGKPCWVFSKQRLDVTEPGVMRTKESPRKVVRELEARGLRRAWLVGGGALAGSFRAEGLTTEYIISVIPIVLGAGVRMFGEDGSPEKLTLVESKRYPSGIVQLRYVKER